MAEALSSAVRLNSTSNPLPEPPDSPPPPKMPPTHSQKPSHASSRRDFASSNSESNDKSSRPSQSATESMRLNWEEEPPPEPPEPSPENRPVSHSQKVFQASWIAVFTVSNRFSGRSAPPSPNREPRSAKKLSQTTRNSAPACVSCSSNGLTIISPILTPRANGLSPTAAQRASPRPVKMPDKPSHDTPSSITRLKESMASASPSTASATSSIVVASPSVSTPDRVA